MEESGHVPYGSIFNWTMQQCQHFGTWINDYCDLIKVRWVVEIRDDFRKGNQ